jgi:hypothetical protein
MTIRRKVVVLWTVPAAKPKMSQEDDAMSGDRERTWSPWYLLLLLQLIPALWVPFYNAVEPSWNGIPFFYWFQMALVIASAALTAIVYFATERTT